ncbi:MAG: hypothetical protein WC546_03185 [Candidatus Omnitrophota bacterium]
MAKLRFYNLGNKFIERNKWRVRFLILLAVVYRKLQIGFLDMIKNFTPGAIRKITQSSHKMRASDSVKSFPIPRGDFIFN